MDISNTKERPGRFVALLGSAPDEKQMFKRHPVMGAHPTSTPESQLWIVPQITCPAKPGVRLSSPMEVFFSPSETWMFGDLGHTGYLLFKR